MKYAYTENGQVIDGPRSLPNGWRNVSGLCYMDDDNLRALGWLPYNFIDNGGEVLDKTVVQVLSDKVVETRVYRYKTEEEIAKETEDKKQHVRQDRNSRLTQCDWTQVDDTPLDNVAKAQWAAYRQALRDVPDQLGFPFNVTWPSQPE